MKIFTSHEDRNFELLVILSLLTKTPLKYKAEADLPAKKDFLDFFLKLTKDSSYTINRDIIRFIPGGLQGGTLKCKAKNIPQMILPLMVFGPFTRDGISLELHGITNQGSNVNSSTSSHNQYTAANSIDMIKIAYSKILKKVNILMGIEIKKRGFDPAGDGIATIKINRINQVDSICFMESELLFKIRGLIITSRISADFTHRMINCIKNIFEDFNDVKVTNILNNKNDSGPSPGYECSLYAESKNGIIFHTVNNKKIPEEVAEECCKEILKKINNGNIFDEELNGFIFTMMGLGRGISQLRVSQINRKDEELLEYLKEFLNIEYYIQNNEDNVLLKIIGCGYVNSAKGL